MGEHLPRIVIGALRGGSGKTLVSIGISALLREMDYSLAVFKKGPDFIDPSWLSLASGETCYNLDQFLMPNEEIISSFIKNSLGKDISIIEGNRGIYDGMDVKGSYSTSELSKLLKAPVILILDVTMSTRTIAAILKGCQVFDKELRIKGVILNRVAGRRQESLIKDCIRTYCNVPVVGSIPKLKENLLKERHMGLVPYQERDEAEKIIDWAKEIVKKYIDLNEILKIAENVEPIRASIDEKEDKVEQDIKIGYLLDKAFWFYYPENLEAIRNEGAELIRIDSIKDKTLPEIDGLYIGGGFPETQAEALSSNPSLRNELKERMEEGLPVYAECGGLMYLGKSLILEGKEYPMVGFFPVSFFLEKRPQGHGYTIVEVSESNPFFKKGKIIKGHEFHYSKPLLEDDSKFAFKVLRGKGIFKKMDGIFKKNSLATYTHIHARGNKEWAKAFVKSVRLFKEERLCFIRM